MDTHSQGHGRHLKFLKMAAKQALKVPYNQRLGAVVVSGGRLLSRGFNDYTRNMHAECSALIKLWPSNCKGATLYVARLRKEQDWGMSRPCPECQKKIRELGIKEVIFTTNDVNQPFAIEVF